MTEFNWGNIQSVEIRRSAVEANNRMLQDWIAMITWKKEDGSLANETIRINSYEKCWFQIKEEAIDQYIEMEEEEGG